MEKTLILPSDDGAFAEKLFNQYVNDEPYTLLVVLGASDIAEATVKRAAKLAGGPETPRYVVWVRKNPKEVAAVMAGLADAGAHILTGAGKLKPKLLAFGISFANHVTGALLEDTEAPDFFRLMELWNSTMQAPPGGNP